MKGMCLTHTNTHSVQEGRKGGNSVTGEEKKEKFSASGPVVATVTFTPKAIPELTRTVAGMLGERKNRGRGGEREGTKKGMRGIGREGDR